MTSAYWGFSFNLQDNIVSRQTSNNTATRTYDIASYEAYGKRTADFEDDNGANPVSLQEPVGFGGQYGYYTDRETGLLCLTHRYYDPGTGRFVNRDPIGYQGGVNLYGFAGGNPVNDSDPEGTSGKNRTLWQRIAHWFFGSADIGISKARHGVSGVYDIDGVKEVDKSNSAVFGNSAQTYIVGSAVIIGTTLATLPTGGAGKAAEEISPSLVRFTQNTASWNFGEVTEVAGQKIGNLGDLVKALKSGTLTANDVKPIRVFIKDGKLFSIDNRRLEAFRRAGVNIRYEMATPEEIAGVGKKHFTTTNEGVSIQILKEPK